MARPPESALKLAKEPIALWRTVAETVPSHRVAEGFASQLPFCHKLGEIGKQRWKELRASLISDLEEGYSPREDPPETERFIPSHFLRNDDSLLLSGRAQLTAADQFTLPRDLDLLREVPTRGLRLALQSYSIRGALIGEELVDRFDHVMEAYGQLTGEVAQERKGREEAERKVKALETEKNNADAKRRRELEMKQSTIANLEAHKSKQSATIAKLKEEIAKLGATIQSSQHEATEREKRVRRLEEEVEAERQAKVAAQESARSDQLALQSLRVELEEVKVAHQAA